MNKTAGDMLDITRGQEERGRVGGGGELLDNMRVIKVKEGRESTGERRDRAKREETGGRTEVGRTEQEEMGEGGKEDRTRGEETRGRTEMEMETV